jgi:uncharacterized protein YneF (UPF0154 family)
MLRILSITTGLELLLNLPISEALAIQNITVFEGSTQSNDIIFNSHLSLELFLLVLFIIAGAFLYNKVTQKQLDSQSPLKELQNRMEVLETIVVNSDD